MQSHFAIISCLKFRGTSEFDLSFYTFRQNAFICESAEIYHFLYKHLTKAPSAVINQLAKRDAGEMLCRLHEAVCARKVYNFNTPNIKTFSVLMHFNDEFPTDKATRK